MQLIEQLIEDVRSLTYPDGIDKVCSDILGPAFVPGGRGLVRNGREVDTYDIGTDIPVAGIMILGNNFDSRAGYKRTKERGAELPMQAGQKITNATWRNLLRLLKEVPIDVEKCFFTNAFMGVMNSDSNCGSHPGHREPAFLCGCRRVFLRSLELQRPRLLITLGLPALKFAGGLSGDCAWNRADGWRSIDMPPLRRQIRIPDYPDPIFVFPLVHPSYRERNAGLRRYLNYRGNEAEIEMLKEAIALTRMS